MKNLLKNLFRKYILYNKFIMQVLTYSNFIRWRRIEILIILWPPVQDLFDEITTYISERVKLKSLNTMEMKHDVFDKFIEDLYAIDFADPKKIALKLDRLMEDKSLIRVLKVEIKKPKIIVQDSLNRVRCESIGDLKDNVRRKFRKQVKNYTYDIVIHSTEVDYQNKLVESLLEKYSIDAKQTEVL